MSDIKQESDLTSKLPIREHLRNAAKVLKKIHELDKYYFPLFFIVHLLHVVCNYMSVILTAYILDGLSEGKAFEEIFRFTAIFVITMFVLRIIESGINFRMGAEQNVIFKRYHSSTEQKMLEMDFAKVNGPECEALRRRVERDMNYSAGLYSVFQLANRIIFCTLNLIGAIVVGYPAVKLMFTSGQIVLLPIVLLIAIISIASTKLHNKLAAEFTQIISTGYDDPSLPITMGWTFAENSQEYKYQNGKDIRIYNGYKMFKKYALDNWNEPGNKAIQNKIKRNEGGQGFFYVVAGRVLDGGSYLMMAILALAGKVSIGNVVKYAGCIMSLFGEIDKLVKIVPNFFLQARKHMSTLELLEINDEMYKGSLPVEKRSDGQYRIEFRNVSFCYPGTEQYALKNFSMELKIGEKLAIVGMNGSGKTTMIKLLCRLYDPQEGEILLNGVDIRKFRQEEYCRLFSVVFQDFQLFSFPLGENVAASSEYDRKKVEKCLTDAGLGERLERLEAGADTYLYKDYEDGVEISGGEAQKIAIARAVYKDAPFILLDEPTAALDPLSEYEIYTSFDRIIGDKTAIYISHRLSSCRFCEKIAVFHEGRLVQSGSHEELVKDEKGKYYDMCYAQAQYYN